MPKLIDLVRENVYKTVPEHKAERFEKDGFRRVADMEAAAEAKAETEAKKKGSAPK